jgi:hypothetical protein
VRDRTAIAVVLLGLAVAAGGAYVLTTDLPEEAAPDADFEVSGDPAAGELVVEHAGGTSVSSGSLRILVYEDRPLVPDRAVHGTVWEAETGLVRPGDRIELEDRRFESGQRVAIRWFGDAGQATLDEAPFE